MYDSQSATAVTVSQKPVTTPSGNFDLTTLPERLDDRTLATVEAIANSPLPALPPCDEQSFVQTIRILQASLPRRSADEISGKLVLATYRKMLSNRSKAEIEFLGREALVRCQWFPTIAECIAILGDWRRSDDEVSKRHRAALLARREREHRLDETMASLQRGELDATQISGLSDWHLRVAEARGLIWNDGDGRYRPRPDPTFLGVGRG
jgi:hypothetical protein